MLIACISLRTRLKTSNGADETVFGGVEVAPRNVLHHMFFECARKEAQTSAATVTEGRRSSPRISVSEEVFGCQHGATTS